MVSESRSGGTRYLENVCTGREAERERERESG